MFDRFFLEFYQTLSIKRPEIFLFILKILSKSTKNTRDVLLFRIYFLNLQQNKE